MFAMGLSIRKPVLISLFLVGTVLAPRALVAQTVISFIQPLGTPLMSTHNGTGAVGLAAGDFDGDGIVDLAVTLFDDLGSGQQGFIAVIRGKGDDTFEAPITLFTLPPNVFARGILAKDFDGDGNPDIVVVCRSLFAGFAVLRGKGDGTFESPVKFAVGSADTAWLDVADVNGNGQPDVVVEHGGKNGNGYTVLINNSLLISSVGPTRDHRVQDPDNRIR